MIDRKRESCNWQWWREPLGLRIGPPWIVRLLAPNFQGWLGVRFFPSDC